MLSSCLFAHTVRTYLRVRMVDPEVTSSHVVSGGVDTGRATPSMALALSRNYPTANKTSPVAPTTSDTEVVPIATYHLATPLP